MLEVCFDFLLFLFAVSLIQYLANGYSYCHLSIRSIQKPEWLIIRYIVTAVEGPKLLVCSESGSSLLLPSYGHMQCTVAQSVGAVENAELTQDGYLIAFISKMNHFLGCTQTSILGICFY